MNNNISNSATQGFADMARVAAGGFLESELMGAEMLKKYGALRLNRDFKISKKDIKRYQTVLEQLEAQTEAETQTETEQPIAEEAKMKNTTETPTATALTEAETQTETEQPIAEEAKMNNQTEAETTTATALTEAETRKKEKKDFVRALMAGELETARELFLDRLDFERVDTDDIDSPFNSWTIELNHAWVSDSVDGWLELPNGVAVDLEGALDTLEIGELIGSSYHSSYIYLLDFDFEVDFESEEHGNSLYVHPTVNIPYSLSPYLFDFFIWVAEELQGELYSSPYMKKVEKALPAWPAREYALQSWESWGELACHSGFQAEDLKKYLEAGAAAEHELGYELELEIELKATEALEELETALEELKLLESEEAPVATEEPLPTPPAFSEALEELETALTATATAAEETLPRFSFFGKKD